MGVLLGSCSHHTWLSFRRDVPGSVRVTLHLRHVAHTILHVQAGSARGSWLWQGTRLSADLQPGFVSFSPADGEPVTLTGVTGGEGLRVAILMIPRSDISLTAAANALRRPAGSQPLAWHDDSALHRCVGTLTTADGTERREAARGLVLRMTQVAEVPPPVWCSDEQGFSDHAVDELARIVDAHLTDAPSASDLARHVGLSPGHFQRRFRRATGMSLHQFVMQRRIRAALGRLKNGTQPIAEAAVALGFSSQSHFTRIFSAITGMTPAKYRKQFGPHRA